MTGTLLGTEMRLLRRHGVLLAGAAVTMVWAGLLAALPGPLAAGTLPWILFLDLAALGFFFAPSLTVSERVNGVTMAHRLSRLSPVRFVAARTGSLTAMVVVSTAGLLLVEPVARPAVVLAGAVLSGILFTLLALVVVGRSSSLTVYLARVPGVAAPLLVPAIAAGTGISESPVLALSPATAALDLLEGTWSWTGAGWITLWAVGLGVVVTARIFDPTPTPAVAPSSRGSAGAPRRQRTAVGALASADRRNIGGDRMLLLLVAAVPLVAIALRWVAGPGSTWIEEQWAADVTDHLPLFWAFALVVHTPMMFGSVCGLLFLEDRDGGMLPALATTRASLSTLVGYRLAATAVAATAAVGLGYWLAGAVHHAGWAGVLVVAVGAGAVSTVPATILAALARDRIHGMAVVKLISLPLYLPLAGWFAPDGWAWMLAAIPTAWPVRAAWSPTLVPAAAAALAGIVLSAAIAVLLARRFVATAA